MQPAWPSYVVRAADEELLRALRRGEYCYILETRQVGKSSLVVRAASRLRAEGGVTIAAIDLQMFGNTATLEQWCESQLLQIGLAVDREDEVEQFWSEHRHLGPLDRWLTGIRQVVLPGTAGLLIIFIDEIDFIRGLPFPTDEYFGGIRGLHSARSTDPELQRVVFCLAGVAVPNELIRNEVLTPFNVARRIELTDFTEQETVEGFAGGFSRPSALLLKRIWYWTKGHPFLTQVLAEAVAADASANRPSDVDRICGALYLNPSGRDQNDNLRFVSARLLAPGVDRANILGLYRRVLSGQRVRDDSANPVSDVLRLSGIVHTVGGRFEVRNPIYRHVFNSEWIERNLPTDEVRRQKEAYARGWRQALKIAGVLAVMSGLLFWVVYANSQTRQADALRERAEALSRLEKQRRDEAEQGRIDAQKLLDRAQQAEKATSAALDVANKEKATAEQEALLAEKSRQQADEALRAKEQIEQNAQSLEARVKEAGRQLADLQKKANDARDQAAQAAVEAGSLKDLSALRRFSALAATNGQYTVAGALAGIEAIGRQTSSEAYQSLLESLARLPRRMGAVPWKRTASSRDANVCESYLDTMERVCWPASAVFQSRNYIVVAPDRNSRRSAQPASDLQYWDIWHQSSFQRLNIAVPPRSALSPSGRYLATPETDAVVTIREFPSGKELFRLGSPIRGPQSAPGAPSFPLYSRAAAIQFSNDERYLITSVVRPGEFDFEHTEFSIWDLEARRRVSWYIGSDRLEFGISPNQNGTRYVWISDGSVCRIPETPKSAKDPGVPLERLFQTPRSPFAVFFSDDGSKLMVTGPFGGLSRGDIQQSSLLYRLPNNTPSVFEHLDSFAVALSPDARLVAFLLGDGLVRVFQTDSQKEVKRIVNEPRGEIKFEDDSHLLTSSDKGALRWGLNDEEVLATTGGNSSLVGFSPEGDSIATGRGGPAVVPNVSFSVFDLAAAPPRQLFYGQGPGPFQLRFSADSAVLAAQIINFPRVSILPLKEKAPERLIASAFGVLEGVTPDVRYAAFGEHSDSLLLETAKVPPSRAALSKETSSFRGFLGFPDNHTIAGCASGQLYRHDLRSPEWAQLSGRDLSVDCDNAGVSADARFVLFRVDSPDRPGVALWNTSDGKLTRLPWSLPKLKKRPTLSLKGTFVFIPQLNEIRKVGSWETVFRGPADNSQAVFAASENLAAVGTYPRTSIVDLGKGGERCSIPPGSLASLIGFDSNASHLIGSVMGRLKAWRAADCQPESLPNLSEYPTESGIMSPDGRFLASTVELLASIDASASRYEAAQDQLRITGLENRETHAIGSDDRITATAFSPDGRFLIAASSNGTARTLDRKSQPAYQDAVPAQIFDADVTSVAISPDSHYAAAAAGASVRMWEIRSGRTIGEIQRSARVPSVSFSRDGKLLAMGESVRRVEVLAVPSLATVKELSLPSRPISVSFSPDGEYLAAATIDGFSIWESKTWTAVASETGIYEARGATFSAAGHVYVAYGSVEAMVWTGKGISTVRRSYIGADIFAAVLSPDGKLLLVASDAGFEVWSVPEVVGREVWPVPEGERLASIGEAVKATGIALSPDGSKVAVVYADGRTKVLPWRRKELIEETCRRLGAAANRFAYEVSDKFDGPYHNYCGNPAAIGSPQ